MPSPTLCLQSLTFAYPHAEPLLSIPHLELQAGDSLFLEGPSGSGKSTLLGLIAGVLSPSAGSVHVLNEDLAKLSVGARDQFRSDHLGIVFQQFNLLPYLSVIANITLPVKFSPARRARIAATGSTPETEAKDLLDKLNLHGVVSKLVGELSVGQQQRVAVARALLGQPELVIADEPTSALDANATDAFIELLLGSAEASTTVLFVSHDARLARHFKRQESLAELNQAPQQGSAH